MSSINLQFCKICNFSINCGRNEKKYGTKGIYCAMKKIYESNINSSNNSRR
jgi:hypothetical protein